jgi:hypothetical protein
MRNRSKIVWTLGVFALATAAVQIKVQLKAQPAPQDASGTIVIVLKNGKQQSFNLADVARIEFNHPSSIVAAPGRARFFGDWTVGDGSGGTFVITLKPDGSAHKTIDSGADGTWTVANGEAQILWTDGWHDVIRKAGTKFQKAAFRPGQALSGTPDNVADAHKHPEPN